MPLRPRPRFRYYGFPRSYLDVASVLVGRHLNGEQHIAALEQRLASWTKARHALCLPRGRLGLYLALRRLIKPGQSVILSPYTIHDVVNMVICAGGQPRFADIKRETGNIDPRDVRALIDDTTGAVIATHLQGLACDIEEISATCRAEGISLIEDAAQCLGGRVAGRHVGSFGDVGIFSFSLKKNVNTLYGGFLITDNDALHENILAELRSFPFENKSVVMKQAAKCLVGDILTIPPVFQLLTFPLLRYDYVHQTQRVTRLTQPEVRPELLTDLPEPYKRRMTPLQARLALRQIDNIEHDMHTRLAYARCYYEGLSDIRGIELPPLREDGSHTYLDFPIAVDDRQKLVKHIMRRGCDVRIQPLTNVADLPCFSAYARDCPEARRTAERVVLLPTYPRYGQREAERLVSVIRSYFQPSPASRTGGRGRAHSGA